MSTLVQLIWSFLQIGLLSIGGGYAALPLIQQQIVDLHGWLSLSEFADIVTIAEMTPGPIAINSATFVGLKVAGLPGAVAATISVVFFPVLIVLLLAWLYKRYSHLDAIQGVLSGLRPAVVALIGSAALKLVLLAFFGETGATGISTLDIASVALFAVCFAAMRIWKPNPLLIIFGSGAVGAALYLFGVF